MVPYLRLLMEHTGDEDHGGSNLNKMLTAAAFITVGN